MSRLRQTRPRYRARPPLGHGTDRKKERKKAKGAAYLRNGGRGLIGQLLSINSNDRIAAAAKERLLAAPCIRDERPAALQRINNVTC
jgi:hypothetical protein